ncbi:hypothetical protein NEISUBOT_05403 [Neisseria subflava NJ9703]|uniref:Uncharacterized protein n=1 Tax=Neisseria subflava NJ9703 TaxID=546268 RepID=A0A9W5MYH0_NEISU|nr:hypothetical protein NEISUBOT_05403 [Neisseria subflava NJ9703]
MFHFPHKIPLFLLQNCTLNEIYFKIQYFMNLYFLQQKYSISQNQYL